MDESNVVHVSMDSSLIAKHKNHSADQDTMRESDDSVKRTRSLSGLQQRVYAPDCQVQSILLITRRIGFCHSCRDWAESFPRLSYKTSAIAEKGI